MSLSKPISREHRIYLAIWRKAFLERAKDKPIILHASNFQMAISIRQGMYRAIRPFRVGIELDEELRQSSDLFIVQIEKNEDQKAPHRLFLKQRMTLTELEKELSTLGLDEEDLLLTEEKMVREQLSDFMEPDPMHKANPFYNREG